MSENGPGKGGEIVPIKHRILTTAERALIVVALHDRNGSCTDTAIALGVSRETMTRLLRKHGIVRRLFRGPESIDVRAAFEVMVSRQFLSDVERLQLELNMGVRPRDSRTPNSVPEQA